MEKIICYDNIRNFAYVNDRICTMPIKGMVINFLGLNDTSMFPSDTIEGEFYGEKGILYVVPYTNPWAWMNRQTVGFTDEILDMLFEKYDLKADTPIVSTGGSMGGQSALVYCAYAKRKPVSCVVNCPVCDVVYHYTERKDLPRTLYSALWQQEGSLEDLLKSVSPLHLTDKLPHIDYHIFHCEDDGAVNIHRHSDVFVTEMRKHDFSVSYDIVPNRDHCKLTYAMKKRFAGYVLEAIGKGESV